jgi:hypothetical protein
VQGRVEVQTSYPALAQEPERIKFVRVDATHYPGEYAPEAYDPQLARKSTPK